eukprot:6212810-Pleurochrysis_carterae.AAC.2
MGKTTTTSSEGPRPSVLEDEADVSPPEEGDFGRSEMAKVARNETTRSVSRRAPRVDPKKGNETRV